ncbi:MAG: SDR family NAD(P)-dependent oxidoreductase [Acidobacteriota bacterium]
MSDDRRIILITGATRGLGRVLAKRYAAMGHTVVGCGRNPKSVEELAQALGSPHHVRSVDVASDGAVAAWIEGVLQDVGVPDLVLNNAALINDRAPLWEVPVQDFSDIVDVNIKGVVNVVRHVVPPMLERGTGVICNISSGWGQFSAPEVGPYCATKFAIEGLTGSLAQELPDGMAAIPLSPGIIHTDMLDTAFGAGAAEHWTADQWVDTAAPFILDLGPEQNGQSIRIPGSTDP